MSQASSNGPGSADPAGGMCPSAEQVELALNQAMDLKSWWAQVEAGSAPVERFELFPATPASKAAWGFFGQAPVQGQTVAVMGAAGDYFYDRPRVPAQQQKRAAKWMLRQVEEFALHYWMRIQSWLPSQPYPELGHLTLPPYLRELSWCPPTDPALAGLGNVQRCYKLAQDGRLGEFPARDSLAIIDLRELGKTYEWVTVDRRLFNFDLTLGVAGSDLPSLVVPLAATMHLVMNQDLIVNQRKPEPGILGAFGSGCGLIKAWAGGPLAFGPGKIQPGLQLQYFQVLDSGEVRLRVVTIMNRPDKILNISADPLEWGLQAADLLTLGAADPFLKPAQNALSQSPLGKIGFDPFFGSIRLLNQLTGNRAADDLCISTQQAEKEILIKSSEEDRQALLATSLTWLQIPDWTDSSAIPEWVVRGDAAQSPEAT